MYRKFKNFGFVLSFLVFSAADMSFAEKNSEEVIEIQTQKSVSIYNAYQANNSETDLTRYQYSDQEIILQTANTHTDSSSEFKNMPGAYNISHRCNAFGC